MNIITWWKIITP